VVDYDPSGSLVTTHRTQGSDLGLAAGLLGWEADDERLKDYTRELKKAGIEVKVRYLDYGAEHPNTYRLELHDGETARTLTAVSTGGGMIEVQALNSIPVCLHGDLHELFIVGAGAGDGLISTLTKHSDVVGIERLQTSGWHLRSRSPWPEAQLAGLGGFEVHVLAPVMPVMAEDSSALPFRTAGEFLQLIDASTPLWQWALRYEASRSGWSEQQVFDKAASILATMRRSLASGLEGRELPGRLLPTQVKAFARAEQERRLVGGSIQNRMIRYVTAIMEAKAGLETIVAAPTAGSCAVLPAALLAVADDGNDLAEETLVKGLLAAGLIGVFVAEGATFSAELGGCMAECGSAAGMAAAGLAEMLGGSPADALCAASIALQNMLGLSCDPIASRVEAPCLGKNAMAASNAINSANMALAGYLHLVPLDQVITAMNEIGQAMPREICCTALGGLSVTPASKALELKLMEQPEL
jgi:L-serine dehydratase